MRVTLGARGATLPEAFGAAALAVLGLAVDTARVEEREVREVRAHGSDVDALLAHWLGECLYVHEVEGFVWRRVEFMVFDLEARAGGEALRLHAHLHGEGLDSERHPRRGTLQRTPSGHVTNVGEGFEVRLVVVAEVWPD
jgi:SHS2 domain-containing protein